MAANIVQNTFVIFAARQPLFSLSDYNQGIPADLCQARNYETNYPY